MINACGNKTTPNNIFNIEGRRHHYVTRSELYFKPQSTNIVLSNFKPLLCKTLRGTTHMSCLSEVDWRSRTGSSISLIWEAQTRFFFCFKKWKKENKKSDVKHFWKRIELDFLWLKTYFFYKKNPFFFNFNSKISNYKYWYTCI